MTIGERLKFLRETRDLSLSQAARLVGCTKSHLWEIESGRADNPGIKLVAGMAEAYGVSIAFLIEGVEIVTPRAADRNTGHGHVWPRPDGIRARCGGPRVCVECALDYARYHDAPIDPEATIAALKKIEGKPTHKPKEE